MSDLEDQLAFQIRVAGIPLPERGFRAIPYRKFEHDFAWPSLGWLVEVQGGTFSRGKMGHNSGMGMHRDMEKGNLAVLEGWKVLYFDEKMIKSGEALRVIQQALTQA